MKRTTRPGADAGTRAAAGAAGRSVEQVRATENFPVALRILPGVLRQRLHALYRYARYVDDLGDELAPGTTSADVTAALDRFEAELRDVYSGRPPRHPVLAELAPVITTCQLPLDPLLRLVEANRVDQVVTRYATFDQLVGYCTLSANPVGELVLHLFGQVGAERIALSDRVCTALQLIEHLQDIAEDRRRGRIYLPKADLDRFGVTESDLDDPTACQPLRDLVALEAERARAYLDSGAPLVATLHGWGRAAVSGYIAGGRAALAALARCGHDPLPAPPKPGRRAVLGQWLVATVRSSG